MGGKVEKQKSEGKGPAGDSEPGAMRRFRLRGFEKERGLAVLEVDGEAFYAVNIEQGEATLTDPIDGPPRAVASFDTKQTLDAIVDGSIHPVVAGLQNRVRVRSGDQRFGLSVLLGLHASAPVFAERSAEGRR